MKIKYLGTCAAEGTPAFFCECDVCRKALEKGGRNIRSRSQCLINDDLLIDYPPDTYMHTINYGLNLRNIKAVLITHTHSDHFCIDDINMNRIPYAMNETFFKLPFYGNSDMCDIMNKTFGDDSTENMLYNKLEMLKETVINSYTIIPLRALHDRNQDCMIFSIEEKGKRFLYGNDTGYFPEDTMECIKGIHYDVISLDSTTGIDRDGNNHMGFEDLVEMKKRLIDNGNADKSTIFIAQHFSHNCGFIYDDAVDYLKPLGFLVAYDGMELEI